jgi:hypothetical protein
MYLANLYVSLLELIADGIEASLDVLGSLVKYRILCQGNCTSIVTKDFSLDPIVRAYLSLSVLVIDDNAFAD